LSGKQQHFSQKILKIFGQAFFFGKRRRQKRDSYPAGIQLRAGSPDLLELI